MRLPSGEVSGLRELGLAALDLAAEVPEGLHRIGLGLSGCGQTQGDE
ncbi:hypothetical protein PEC18_38505 [Paucibacter sp. O1-1]|nr:hypothetical protein [Paucibacter sp. O1-1]MDA3831510.1 hypothetical protein [Paucibacter sp. O1-1]